MMNRLPTVEPRAGSVPPAPPLPEDKPRTTLQDEVWQEIHGRIVEVNDLTARQARDETAQERRLGYISGHARLFFSYHIPAWPPRLLLRKLIRKLMAPLLLPQADWNEAVRDVLMEMHQRHRAHETRQQKTDAAIDELQDQISDLQQQVMLLEAQLRQRAHRGEGAAQ